MAPKAVVLRKRIRILLDTNVLIEAFRTGVWPAIRETFSLETVEKCIEEALTGDPSIPGYVRIDHRKLKNDLHCVHKVDKLMLSNLIIHHPHCAGLDDGELHLFAWLYSKAPDSSDRPLICTADKAAVYAANRLSWLDDLISLQEIGSMAGISRKQTNLLATHHKAKWLDNLKATIRLMPSSSMH